ncbi:hypothetical protein [Nitratiruptor sp. YY09-18]|uniref:hypothetical protein n=1 Tax=Nitratiruptor sp. YY09-18 TaxID=2724901 RepID=UPI0019156889|nr:hypothetical protein [Nitratiruptor sp. YY09-18]BCD67936.1 hypothetical protein NitYY0918_C0843 [Nitratiruptor sp. YY09-18]
MDLPKNVEELKEYVAENFAKLSAKAQLEILKTLHKFIHNEEIVKKELELEQKVLDEEKATQICAIDDEEAALQEEILEEIRKHNHVDVHAFKDASKDPRDEDAKYVDKTMDKIPNDPNDPLADYLDELEDQEKSES